MLPVISHPFETGHVCIYSHGTVSNHERSRNQRVFQGMMSLVFFGAERPILRPKIHLLTRTYKVQVGWTSSVLNKFIAELWQTEGPPSETPYPFKQRKPTN